MSLEIDVSYLTPEEREAILRVLKRDEIIRNTDQTRVKRLRRKSESASYRDKLRSRIFTGEWFDQLTAPGRRVIKNISEALQKVIMVKTTTVTTTEVIIRDRGARGTDAATDTETSTRTTDVSGEESRALNFESHSVTRTDSAVAVTADGNRNTREIFHETELTLDGTHPRHLINTEGLHTAENASRRPRPRPGTASGSVSLRSRSRDEERVHARLESHGRRSAGSEISNNQQSGNTDCQSKEIPHFTDQSVNENKGTIMIPGEGTERTSLTEDDQTVHSVGESETYDTNDLIDVGTDEIIGPDYDKNQVKEDIVGWMSDNLTEAMRNVVAVKNAQQSQPIVEEIVIPLSASSLQEMPMRNAVDIDQVKEELSSRISDTWTELETSHAQDSVRGHSDHAHVSFEPLIVPAKRKDNFALSQDSMIKTLEEAEDKIDEKSSVEDHRPSDTHSLDATDSTVERNSEFGVKPYKYSRKLSRQNQVITEDTIVPTTAQSLHESREKDEIDMKTVENSLTSGINESLEELKTFDTELACSNDTELGIISSEPHIVPIEVIDRVSSKEGMIVEEGIETDVDSNAQEYQVTGTNILQEATGTAETEREFGVEQKESSSKGTSTHSLQSSNNKQGDDVSEQITLEAHARTKVHHSVTLSEDVEKSSQLATSASATIELPEINRDVSDILDLPAYTIGQLSSGSDDGSGGDEKLSLLQFLESLPTIKPTDSPARHTSPVALPAKIFREISMDSITSTDAVITLLDDMMTKVEDIMVEVDDYNEAYANENIATGNIPSGKVEDVKFATSEPMALVEKESHDRSTLVVDDNETQPIVVESRAKLVAEETVDDRHANIEDNKKFDDKSVIEVKEEEDVIIPSNVSDMTAATNVIANQGEGNNEIVGKQEISQLNEFQADERQTYELQTRNDVLQSEIHFETQPLEFSVDASSKSDEVVHIDPPSTESSAHIKDDYLLESNRAGSNEEESLNAQNEGQNLHYEVSHETDILDAQQLMCTSSTEPLTLFDGASTTQDVDETAGIVANEHEFIENTVEEGGYESESNDGSGAPFELEDIPSSNESSCSETSNQLDSYIKYSDVEHTPDIAITFSVNTTKIPTISITDYDEEMSEMTLAKFVEENDGSDSDIYISDADEVVYHRESSYSPDVSEGSGTSDEYFVEKNFSGNDVIQTSEFHSLPENEGGLSDLNTNQTGASAENVEIYEVAGSQAYAREPYKTDEMEISVAQAHSSLGSESNSAMHADTGDGHFGAKLLFDQSISGDDTGGRTISSMEVTEEDEDDAHYFCYDVDKDEEFEIGNNIRSSATESPSNIERNLYPIVEESEQEDDLHSDNSSPNEFDRAQPSVKDVSTQNEVSSMNDTFAEPDQSNASINHTSEMKSHQPINTGHKDENVCDPVVHVERSTATESTEYEGEIGNIIVSQMPAIVDESIVSEPPDETKLPATDSDGTHELEKGMSNVENSPQPGECIRENTESAYDEADQIRSASILGMDDLPAVSPVSVKMISTSDVAEIESVGVQVKGDNAIDGDAGKSLDKPDEVRESIEDEVDENTISDDVIDHRGIATTEDIDVENGIEKTRPKIIKKSLKRKTVKRKTGKSHDGKADVLKKSTKKKVLKKIKKSCEAKQDEESSPVELDDVAQSDIELDDKQPMDNQNETLSLETNSDTVTGHAMGYTIPPESSEEHSDHLEGGISNENVQFFHEETKSKSSSQKEIQVDPQDSKMNLTDSVRSEVTEPSGKDNFDAEQQLAFPTNLKKELIDDQHNIVIGPTKNVETYIENEILGDAAAEVLVVTAADDKTSLDEESNTIHVSDITGTTKMLSFGESIEKVELFDICAPIVSDLPDETSSSYHISDDDTPQIDEHITGEFKSKEYVDDRDITLTEVLDKPSDDNHTSVYVVQTKTSKDIDKHEYQDSSHDNQAPSEIFLSSASDTSAILESRGTPGIEILEPSTEGNDVIVYSLDKQMQVEEHAVKVNEQSTNESQVDIPTDENTSEVDANYLPSQIGEPIQDPEEPICDVDASIVTKLVDNRALNELIHEKTGEFEEETNNFVNERPVQIDAGVAQAPDNQEEAIELSADLMLRADEKLASIDESTEQIEVNALAQQTDITSEENQTSHIQMLDQETGADVEKIDSNIESVETEIKFVSTKYLIEERSSVSKTADYKGGDNENEGAVTDTPSVKTADQEHDKTDEQHIIDGEFVPTLNEVTTTGDLSSAFDNIEERVPERTKAGDEISVQMIGQRVDRDIHAEVATTGSSIDSEITTLDTSQTLIDKIHVQVAEEGKSTALSVYENCTVEIETTPAGDFSWAEACVDDTHQENDQSAELHDNIISERIEEIFEKQDIVRGDKLVDSHDSELKELLVGDKPIDLMNRAGNLVETQKYPVAKESTESLVVETESFNIDVANEDCGAKELSNEEYHSDTVVLQVHGIGHEGIEASPTTDSESSVNAIDSVKLLDTAAARIGEVDLMHERTPEVCDPVHVSGLHTEEDISSSEERNSNAMPSQSIDEMKDVTATDELDKTKENSPTSIETIVDQKERVHESYITEAESSSQSVVTDAVETAETNDRIVDTDNTVDINEGSIETFIKESSPLVVKKSVRRKTIKKKGQKSGDETTDIPTKSTKKKVVKVIKKSTVSVNEVNISLEDTASVQEAASSEAVVDDDHSQLHQPQIGETSQEPVAIDDAATSRLSETKTEPAYKKFEQDSSTSELQSTTDIQVTTEDELDTGFDIDEDVTASPSDICSSHDQKLDISPMPDVDFSAENNERSIHSNSESSRKKTHRISVRKKKSQTNEEENVKKKSVRIKVVKRPLKAEPEITSKDEAVSSGVAKLSHNEDDYAMNQRDLSTTATVETSIPPDISTDVDIASYDEGSTSAPVQSDTPTKVEEEDVGAVSSNTGDNELMIENDNSNIVHDATSKDGTKLFKKKTMKKKKASIDSKQKSPKKVIKRKTVESGQVISPESAPSFPEDRDQPVLEVDESLNQLPTYGHFDQSLDEGSLTVATDVALNAMPENEVAEMLIGEIIDQVLSECHKSHDKIDPPAVIETLQPSMDESNGNIRVDSETLTDGKDKLVVENSYSNPLGDKTTINVSNSEQQSISETSDATDLVSQYTSVSEEAIHEYQREAVQSLTTSEGEITDGAQTATENKPQSISEDVEALVNETVNFLATEDVCEIIDAVGRTTSPGVVTLATEGGTDDSFLVEPNHQFDTLDTEDLQSSDAQSTNEDQDGEKSLLAMENSDDKVLIEPDVDIVLGQASEPTPNPAQADHQLASGAGGLDSELEVGLTDINAKDSDQRPIPTIQKFVEENEDHLKTEPDHASSAQSIGDPLDTVEAATESSITDKTSAPEENILQLDFEIAESLVVESIEQSVDENQKTANSALDFSIITRVDREQMSVTNELAYESGDTSIDHEQAELRETSRIKSHALDESGVLENSASVGVGEISNLPKTETEVRNTESSVCQSADQPTIFVESKKDSICSKLVEPTDHDIPDDQPPVAITVSESVKYSKKKIGGRIYVKKTRRSRRRSAVEKRAISATDSPDGSLRHSSDEYFSNDSMFESSDDEHLLKGTSLEEQHDIKDPLPSSVTQALPLKSESVDLPSVSVSDSQQDASESVSEFINKIPRGENEENNSIHDSVVGAEPCENLLVDINEAGDTEKEEKDDTVQSRLSVESEISAEPTSESKEFENDAASSSKAKKLLMRKATRKKKKVESSNVESGGKLKKKVIQKIQQRESNDTTSQETVETSLSEVTDEVPDISSGIAHPAVAELQQVSADMKSDFSVESSRTVAIDLGTKDVNERATDTNNVDRTDNDDSAASATKQSQQNSYPPTAVPRRVVKKTIRKKKGNNETSTFSKKSVKKVVKMLPLKIDPIDLQVKNADVEETSDCEDIHHKETNEFTSQDEHNESENERFSTVMQTEGSSTYDSPYEISFHKTSTENLSDDKEPNIIEAEDRVISELCEGSSVRQRAALSGPNVTERHQIGENISSDEPSSILPTQDTATKEDVASETIDTEHPVHNSPEVLKESRPTEIKNMRSDETMEKTTKMAGAEGFESENLIAEETFEILSKDGPSDTCKGAMSDNSPIENESVAIKSDIADVNVDAFVNASSDGNEYIDSTNINETLNKDDADVFIDAVSHELQVSQDVISGGGAIQHDSIPTESTVTDETVDENDTDLFMDALSDEHQSSQDFIADGLATKNESVSNKDEASCKSDPDEFTATVSEKKTISDDDHEVQNEPNASELAIADETLRENDPDVSVDTPSDKILISADILSNAGSSKSPRSTDPPQNGSPDSSILERDEKVSEHLDEGDNDSTTETESQNLDSPVTVTKTIRKVVKTKRPKSEPKEHVDAGTSQTKSVRKKVVIKKKNQTPSAEVGSESSNITMEASTENINTPVLDEGMNQTVDSIPVVTASTDRTSQESASAAAKPKVVKRVKKSPKKPQKVEVDEEKDESSRKPTVKRKTIKKVQKS